LAERRRADEERKRLIAECAAQIRVEHGAELERQAVIRLVESPETREAAADEMARMLAERGARPGNLDWRDHREVPDEAIGKVFAVEEASRRRELEAEATRNAALGADKTQHQDALKSDWRATAHEVLDRNRPLPPRAGPSQPTSSPPPSPTKGPLNANEVLQRFGDADLEARYQQDHQRREQRAKSSSARPETAASVIARSNNPAGAGSDTDLMSAFSTAAIKKKAEEEKAARANDPSKGLGRGGGRGR
jgi:hypothetical protein